MRRRGRGVGLLRKAGSLLPERAQAWLDAPADGLQQAGEAAQRRNLAEAAEATSSSPSAAATSKTSPD